MISFESSDDGSSEVYSELLTLEDMNLNKIKLQIVLAAIENDEAGFNLIQDYIREQPQKLYQLNFLLHHTLETLRSAAPSYEGRILISHGLQAAVVSADLPSVATICTFVHKEMILVHISPA